MTQLIQAPAPAFPGGDECLCNAWVHALLVTSNGRTKLTNADVLAQPSHERAVWDNYPLTRLANWYVREGGSDTAFVQSIRHDAHKRLTPAQVRGAVNVMLASWKRGYKAPWMVLV